MAATLASMAGGITVRASLQPWATSASSGRSQGGAANSFGCQTAHYARRQPSGRLCCAASHTSGDGGDAVQFGDNAKDAVPAGGAHVSRRAAIFLGALGAYAIRAANAQAETIIESEKLQEEVLGRIKSMKAAVGELSDADPPSFLKQQFSSPPAPAAEVVEPSPAPILQKAEPVVPKAPEPPAPVAASEPLPSLPELLADLTAPEVGPVQAEVVAEVEAKAVRSGAAVEAESTPSSSGGGIGGAFGFLGTLGFGTLWYLGMNEKKKVDQELLEANEQIVRKEELMAILQEEVEAQRFAMKRQESQMVAVASKEKFDLNSQLLLEKELGAELKKSLEVEKLAVSNLAHRAEMLQSSLREAEERESVLEGRLVDVTKQLEEKQAEAAMLRDKLAIEAQQLRSAEGKCRQLEDDYRSASMAFLEKEKEALSLGRQLDMATDEARETDKFIAGLRMELTSLNQIIMEEEAKSQKLSLRLQETQDALEGQTREVALLRAQLAASAEQVEELEAKLSKLRAEADNTTAQLNQERRIAATAQIQLESTQKALAEERDVVRGLKDGVSQASEALDAMAREVQILSDQIQVEQSITAAQQEEAAALKTSLAEGQKQLKDLQVEKEQVIAAAKKVEQEKSAALARVDVLEADMNTTKGEMLRLRGQVTELNRTLQVAESKIENIAQVRAEAALMVEHFEDVAHAEKEEKERLKEKYGSLEKESNLNKNMVAELATELSETQQRLVDAKQARAEAEAALSSIHSSSSIRPPPSSTTSKKPAPLPKGFAKKAEQKPRRQPAAGKKDEGEKGADPVQRAVKVEASLSALQAPGMQESSVEDIPVKQHASVQAAEK